MTDKELRQAATEQIHEGLAKAAKRYNIELPPPLILFNLTGRTAGQANGKKWRIRLNMPMLRQNGVKFLERTPVHEAAHLVVHKLYGDERYRTAKRRVRKIKPHGPEWQGVMRSMGVRNPTRCHSYSTENVGARKRRGPKYLYECGCQEHWMSGCCHRRAQAGARYRCRSCKRTLVYQGRSRYES